MTDLLFRVKGNSDEARKALQDTTALVDQQAAAIVGANERIGQSAKLSSDLVFRQLTQFRIGLTQIGRGDLGGVPNLIAGIQLAGAEASKLTPKIANASQVFKVLDSVLQETGFTLLNAKTLFSDFQAAVSLASNGTTKEARQLRREFELLGLDLTTALAKPDAAFKALLATLASGKGKAQVGNILSIGDAQVATLAKAGKAVNEFEAAETGAAAASTALAAGLSATTLVVGAFVLVAVGAVAAAIKIALSFKDAANEAQRLADETGLSVEQIRLLSVAGTAANVEVSKITTTFTQFREQAQRALNETGEEADKVRRLFSVLGVDVKKAAESPLEAYEKLIITLEDVRDVETRSAASKVLLGARSEDLRRLFTLLNADGGALRKELQSLLGTIDSSAPAVSEYNVAVAKLEATWESFKDLIGGPVILALTKVLSFLSASARAAEQFGSDIRSTIEAIKGNEAFFSGGVDFGFGDGPNASDFGAGLKDKTDAVKNALKERNAATKAANDEAAKLDLQVLQNSLRNLDAEYQIANNRLKQRLDEQLITEAQYTEKLKAVAAERERLALEILAAEEARVTSSKLKPTDQARELQRIAQERIEIERRASVEIEGIEGDARLREQRQIERFQAEILNTLRLVGDQKIALIEDQINQQILSEVEGQRRINAVILDLLQQRTEAQRALVNSLPDGGDQRQLETEKLKQLEIERANVTLEAERKVRQSRARDLANYRDYVTGLRDLQNDTAQLNVDALIEAQQITNIDAIRVNAALQQKILEDEAAERIAILLAQLNANADYIAQDEKQKQQQIENEQRLTELILAENEKRTAGIALSKAREAEAVRQQNKTLKDSLSLGVDAVKAQGRAIIASFLTGQTSARQAATAFYDALTQPLVDFLIDEGIAQSVLAARDLANLNFPGAALHTAAALALFGGAALIGAGSRAIAGSPSTTASAGAPSLTGTRQDQNTISTEERIRFRESGALQPVTTIVIKHETGMFVEKVETALTSSYRNEGTARKLIDNATTGRPT